MTERAPLKRASELLLGVEVEGEQVRLEELADRNVVVKSVGFFDSDLGPSAAVVVLIDDEPAWFITASGILMEAFDKLKDQMPFVAKFVHKTSGSGRRYWTVE